MTRFSSAMLGVAIVGLVACEGMNVDPVSTPPPPATIQISEGDQQYVMASSIIDKPVIASVLDVDGRPVPNVPVRWDAEGGTLLTYPDRHLLQNPVVLSDAAGRAAVFVRADVEGELLITATVVSINSSVTFRIRSGRQPIALIHFGPLVCRGGPSTFYQPHHAPDIADAYVGVGITFTLDVDADGIECEAKLTTVSVPSGGAPFTSGLLHWRHTFSFTPMVAGTWVIQDVMNGGEVRITVHP